MSDGTTCDDPINHHKYIMDFTCTNLNVTSRMLTNMRLSFPSGHSTIAFASAIFCVLYIQARITWRGSKLMKHFLQMLFIAGAAYTGFSRISDHKHHWSDVLGGSLLGIVIAFVFAIYSTDLFKRRNIKEERNGTNHQV